MKISIKTGAIFIACLAIMLGLTGSTSALSGTNMNKVEIKVSTKQGGDWFRSLTKKTDSRGVLKAKDALPGKYKMTISNDDRESGQTLAIEMRMLDRKGRRLKEKTDVDLYMYINDVKTSIGTVQTDEDGWLKASGMQLDTEYYIDITDDSHVSKKEGEVRIKAKAKIDRSDWFDALYKRTENGILEAKNVLPGKYKFKYKTGDADSSQPFTLRAQLLTEKGEDIDDPTEIEIYVYINKVRQLVGTVETDDDGWVTLPGTLTGMKYKLKMK